MKYSTWYLIIAVLLLALSAVFYMFQIHIFHNEEETFFLMLQDLSFVPINVLLVTLIIDRLLKRREKQNLLNKMNMVIGVFFNEIGRELIKICGGFIENIPRVLPEGVSASIHLGSWPVPAVFGLIQATGSVPAQEMYRVFNMGIGMVVITSADQIRDVQQSIPEETWVIGKLVPGERKVILK